MFAISQISREIQTPGGWGVPYNFKFLANEKDFDVYRKKNCIYK